ncbi:hypothetical protein [Mesorhizobium cantuariense]|uniref:Uncharacterized protein n=1 Tax=Mesorhizobium cantuariense TaxID=1300275 RepID=A0ABV7MTQ1_9HYPH
MAAGGHQTLRVALASGDANRSALAAGEEAAGSSADDPGMTVGQTL